MSDLHTELIKVKERGMCVSTKRQMTLTQCILIGFVYYIGKSNLFAAFETIYRPLVCGWLVGCILGKPAEGAMIGATINLIYIGFIGAGGATPGDPALAGTVATALALSAGLDTDAALALAATLGLVGSFVWVGCLTINSFFVRIAEDLINKGKEKLMWFPGLVCPMLVRVFLCWIPVALACYYGVEFTQNMMSFLGGKVIGGMSAVGGMLPAVGIAMNLQAIFKGESKIFLFVGFALSVFLKLPVIAIAIFAACAAVIYTSIKLSRQNG